MTTKKEMKFESAVNRLEEIVEELETGEFDLDKAVEIFEEGMKLSKFCKKKLDDAEQKVEIIKKQKIKDLDDGDGSGYTKEESKMDLLLDPNGE